VSDLVKTWWPEFCRQNRKFLNENDIVIDLINKIRGNRSTLTWWTLIEREDVIIFNRQHRNLIARYYDLKNIENPHFTMIKESLNELQLNILFRVWEKLHETDRSNS
jgi:hypothetical protein